MTTISWVNRVEYRRDIVGIFSLISSYQQIIVFKYTILGIFLFIFGLFRTTVQVYSK